LALARKRALFSLHVTKTLKYSSSSHAELHVFGSALSPAEEDSLLSFLNERHQCGPESAGYHHLRHAQLNAKLWSQHLSKEGYEKFANIAMVGHR
jgi:hypothetical protein